MHTTLPYKMANPQTDQDVQSSMITKSKWVFLLLPAAPTSNTLVWTEKEATVPQHSKGIFAERLLNVLARGPSLFLPYITVEEGGGKGEIPAISTFLDSKTLLGLRKRGASGLRWQ